MQEFDFINALLKPLARRSTFSLGLEDDAAHIPLEALGGDLVLTCDTIVAGTHFLPDDPADSLGRKALRVNLSDLAAKGATPLGAILALSLPKGTDPEWLKDFTRGLSADCAGFKIPLIGGDTTSTQGPLTITITALGTVQRPALLRSGGKAEQLVCVSGQIGWGWLGLQAATQVLELPKPVHTKALDHYRMPEPKMALGQFLLHQDGIGASMDISDGLMADCRHLAKASGLKAELDLSAIPLASPDQHIHEQLGGGDDYQLLFSCEPLALPQIQTAFPDVAAIGRLTQGDGLVLLDKHKSPIALTKEGFVHE